MALLLIIWIAAFACYLLLAGPPTLHEAAVAAILATGASGWSEIIRRKSRQRFSAIDFFSPWPTAIRHLPRRTFQCLRPLAAAAAGGGSVAEAYMTAFERGTEDAAQDRARRAAALLAASLAPDSFVVRMPPEQPEAVIHALVPPPGTPDARWLT